MTFTDRIPTTDTLARFDGVTGVYTLPSGEYLYPIRAQKTHRTGNRPGKIIGWRTSADRFYPTAREAVDALASITW